MKNRLILFPLAIACVLILSSCNKKQNAIDNLSNFVEKVEKKAPEYTDEDWSNVNNEFNELIAEIDKYEYSVDDTERIAGLKGKYTGIKAKYTVNKFFNDIDKAAKEIKGVIEGFTEGITGGNDSQEEEKQ